MVVNGDERSRDRRIGKDTYVYLSLQNNSDIFYLILVELQRYDGSGKCMIIQIFKYHDDLPTHFFAYEQQKSFPVLRA